MTISDIVLIIVLIIECIILYRQRAMSDIKKSLEAHREMLALFDIQKFKDLQKLDEEYYNKKLRVAVSKEVEDLKLFAKSQFDKKTNAIMDESLKFVIVVLGQGDKSEKDHALNTFFPESKAFISELLLKFGPHQGKAKD